MRPLWSFVALPFVLLPIAFAWSTAEGQSRTAEGPLVIELFTSQGCSSCPPADRILAKLATKGLEGKTLAPLAFHVDYWDDLGWPDPHASPAWTERQRDYARALRDDRVYTPQLVVGGANGMVGSNLVTVTNAIASAARPALLPATATWLADSLEVTATAPADADVIVVVWDDAAATSVKRGENAGDTLGNARAVRRLERVARAGVRGTITVKIDPAWRSVGAVAFAQRADRKIVSSALLPR
jgi:hypothetical protein